MLEYWSVGKLQRRKAEEPQGMKAEGGRREVECWSIGVLRNCKG